MKHLKSNKLYEKISEHLLHSDFIALWALEIEFIYKHIEDKTFQQKIEEMIEKKDFSCKAVLGLCNEMMDLLAEEDRPKNWLNYIYQFVLSKSFPKAVEIELRDILNKPCIIYLNILRMVSEFEKEVDDALYTIRFLTGEEYDLESMDEYKRFKEAFENEYIYEMMKFKKEVIGYNTLEHVCGVHTLALFIGRQLKKAELPIDLGRISGAAAGHDIGKFGCRVCERERESYLKYYYTDQWFKKHNISYIGNIAVNHATWDLEFENLSLESLVLIYCDFRVKKKKIENMGKMYIYTLKESFDLILQKLDNADEAKEKRLHRVYAKLKDFENYMMHLGIHTEIETENKKNISNIKNEQYTLMQGKEIIENIKYLSIQHNIYVMDKLRDESSLNAILENARSEIDLNNLRGYLHVFEEYYTYMTQKQKMIIINFLYEQLMHPRECIRKKCAEIMGVVIANFDEAYRKEVPKDVILKPSEMNSYVVLDKYLDLLIDPDPQAIMQQRIYLGRSISNIFETLLSNCDKSKINGYIEVLLKYYEKDYEDQNIQKYLLETAKHVPLNECDKIFIDQFMNFIQKMILSKDPSLRLYGFENMYQLLHKASLDKEIKRRLQEIFIKSDNHANVFVENFLKWEIAQYFALDEKIIENYKKGYREDKKNISDIFLSNLKTSTELVVKKVQINFLLQYAMNHVEKIGRYTAIHYCNILKVSDNASIRNHAGTALLSIVPHIPFEQRNDVVVELLRGLEIEGYQFAKYIPKYLGKLMLYLKPTELDQLIEDLIEKIKQANAQSNTLLLKTMGVATQNYHVYKDLFEEEEKNYDMRLVKMLSVLQNGLVHYNVQVKQAAFRVIGKDIFGSKHLKLSQKNNIFQLIAKKLLTLIGEENEEKILTFFIHAAALKHIYGFISAYTFYEGELDVKLQQKVAFFPGTFDPFSLGHKEIAKEIRSLGFEVYLAVDEFSWSKKTQPHLMRRDIIKMSIADELGIYLYPKGLSTNIANDSDLKVLRESFPYADVHIVTGSDVVLNASAYKKAVYPNSIQSFSHIIFERKSTLSKDDDDKKIDEAIKNIKNKVIRLSLPPQYEDISSTQIRNYIDQNREISKLIDPIAQKFIYEKGLYRREPQYKTLMETKSVSVELVKNLGGKTLSELSTLSFMNFEESYAKLKNFSKKLNPRILILRSIEKNGEILGVSAFHWVRSSMLFKEFKDENISEYIRKHAIGRILVMDGIFVKDQQEFENMEQMMLTETLAYALPKDYTYAVYKNMMHGTNAECISEILKCQGFEQICHEENPVFVVSMTHPCSLYLDIESIIKEPFRSNQNVMKMVRHSRKKLQEAITKLYPGNLVISFDRNMVYENLIKKICDENRVSTIPTVPRQLGTDMCVPFGAILNGAIVPNTVTKSMHTEKIFDPDMKRFVIEAYPNYLDLENQVKMIHSFNRPVILVDDLLNKGYRIKAIDPLLKNEKINVKKIIVGILSGRGKELMDMQNRKVDCAYFIPKLRVWFNESFLYPFIGGDTLWRGDDLKTNLVPSVNLILPYTVPTFIRGAKKDTIYHLSQTCIENAIEILETLEEEYQKINERSLTLRNLGEVFIASRYPDHGEDMNYDLSLHPSHYLRNDLEHLSRLKMLMVDRHENQ
ncbi:cytidyltransferase [Marinisporobacter balticus]|uniref:nicotinate-nucleotide adenylyltransferase n=1 Tax=Marinisporobacter balticus TaxID=2018667 RepID=A0A4V2SBZ9_9FIRM|nr:cytidyltransferase [Marinisporobacter balticus]TCO77460.1 nicotinic acid mononucleotide adenylyltransferase [Marinisporobacter balticus]